MCAWERVLALTVCDVTSTPIHPPVYTPLQHHPPTSSAPSPPHLATTTCPLPSVACRSSGAAGREDSSQVAPKLCFMGSQFSLACGRGMAGTAGRRNRATKHVRVQSGASPAKGAAQWCTSARTAQEACCPSARVSCIACPTWPGEGEGESCTRVMSPPPATSSSARRSQPPWDVRQSATCTEMSRGGAQFTCSFAGAQPHESGVFFQAPSVLRPSIPPGSPPPPSPHTQTQAPRLPNSNRTRRKRPATFPSELATIWP